MHPSTALAELLREQRARKGRTLREAAGELGIAPSQLSRLENGKRRINGTLGQAVSNYYEISPDILTLAEGRVPADIAAILMEHPDEIARLRAQYQTRTDGDESTGHRVL